MPRPESLTRFIDAAHQAVLAGVERGGRANAIADRIFAAFAATPGTIETAPRQALPACEHLPAALQNARAGTPRIRALADALAALEPSLHWQRRAGAEALGEAFARGHANTWIAGPEGLERRADVILGASLLAPQVRYPDHDHPPEELYVVMSEGDWRVEGAPWTSPGVGGIVHHLPGITHAMRSGAAPLLAVWCLWVGR